MNSSQRLISNLRKFDLILEETGVATQALQALGLLNPNGLLCLLGIYGNSATTQDLGEMFREVVLGNKIVFGAVNAKIRYFIQRLSDFQIIKRQFAGVLLSLFTKILPPQRFVEAYSPTKDDNKSIIEFQAS